MVWTGVRIVISLELMSAGQSAGGVLSPSWSDHRDRGAI
jgi:hypothetical protein